MNVYRKYVKRALDIILSLILIILLSPVLCVLSIVVRFKLGSPIIFSQYRPGKEEKIFKMYKFRSMTDEKDESGRLLPDNVRLTKFGKKLRATSLDELPELINILKGDMSFVGPRPQLVKDMVFMTTEQRTRHGVRPGLTGLAQINGRNAIKWEEKLNWDLKYLENISLYEDLHILIKTFKKAFIKHDDINEENMATAMDFGDYLLKKGTITLAEYEEKQDIAEKLLTEGIRYNEN